jgi:uncharacterized damage-inducible protein DinB
MTMSGHTSIRPTPDEFAAFYAGYVGQVPDGDVLDALEQGRQDAKKLLGKLSEAQAAHRYAPGKWSIKGVVGHIADAERVFVYRALWFARGGAGTLPGWDENAWAAESNFDAQTLKDLLRGYSAVRDATLALFRSLPGEVWTRRGSANNNPVTVRALAWITAGHERHHLKILRERYLN